MAGLLLWQYRDDRVHLRHLLRTLSAGRARAGTHRREIRLWQRGGLHHGRCEYERTSARVRQQQSTERNGMHDVRRRRRPLRYSSDRDAKVASRAPHVWRTTHGAATAACREASEE